MKILLYALEATTIVGFVAAFVNHAKYRAEQDKVRTMEAYNRVLIMRVDSLREELGRASKPSVPTAEVVTKIAKKLPSRKVVN